MSNVISFVGRLGKDAETRQAGSTTVTGFSIANNVGWGDKKTTLWFDCSIWGARGEKMCSHLEKGKEVFVAGEMSEREHDGKVYKQLNISTIDFVGGGGQQQDSQQPVQYSKPGEDCPF